MQVIFIICSILALILTGVATYFEILEKKKSAIVCIALIAFFSLLSLGAQQINDYKNNKESSQKDSTNRAIIDSIKLVQIKVKDTTNKLLKKQNQLLIIQNQLASSQNDILRNQLKSSQQQNQLLEYTTGGKGNKPILDIDVIEDSNNDNTYLVYFNLYNFGKYPISNVFYEFEDHYTVYNDYFVANKHLKVGNLTEQQILELNKFSSEHSKEKHISGSIANLPQKNGNKIYVGKAYKNSIALMYNITLRWNNQSYSAIYQLVRDKKKREFRMFKLDVSDGNGKATDLQKFFPTVPKSFWTGFPTKIDTTPRTYQFRSDDYE